MGAIYLIQAICPKGEHFIYETTLNGNERSAIVRDLASSAYDVGPIERVIEVDVESGSSRGRDGRDRQTIP